MLSRHIYWTWLDFLYEFLIWLFSHVNHWQSVDGNWVSLFEVMSLTRLLPGFERSLI